MTSNQIAVTGIYAQLYSRLISAAILGTHVYYSDLSPVVYGVNLTRMNASQYDALWDLVVATMRTDIENGRPPVAALFVSRSTDSKTPSKRFFQEYHKLTGKRLTDHEWQALVEQVWQVYTPNLRGLS